MSPRGHDRPGMAPSGAPQKRANMARVSDRARPVDLTGTMQPPEQLMVQTLPHAGLLPLAQPPPARHTRAIAKLRRQVVPRDPRVQHVQDPVQRLAVIKPVAARVPEAARHDRDQRLNHLPQLIRYLDQRHLHLQQSTTSTGSFDTRLHNPFLKQALREPPAARSVSPARWWAGETGSPPNLHEPCSRGPSPYCATRC